jgi:cold shock CspA family protein
MPTGKVKMYNEDKGIGLIIPDDGGPNVFFHTTLIESGLAPRGGQHVTFEMAVDKKTGRERATSVRQSGLRYGGLSRG